MKNPIQFVGYLIFGIIAVIHISFIRSKPSPGMWIQLILLSMAGGALAGALIASRRRFAGAIGGFVGLPCGLIGLFFYLQGRNTVFRAEIVLVELFASLPGFGVYFIVAAILDAVFPERRRHADFEDDDDDLRPRRRSDDFDNDDDDRPRRRRRDEDEDYEDRRPRRKHRDDFDDDEDRPRRGRSSRDDFDD